MEELLEELVKNYNCIDNYFTSVKCVLDSNRVAEFESAVTNKDLCANFAKFLNEYHYVLFPCQKFIDYKSFIDGVLGEFVKWHQSEESDEYEDYSHIVEEAYKLKVSLEAPFEYGDKSTKISKINCVIGYPVSNVPIFEFAFNPDVEITNGLILYTYTIAYQLMYKIEDYKSPPPTQKDKNNAIFIMNRDSTDGPFGIWGHVIDDLVYNGINNFVMLDNELYCHFSCDS